MKQHKILVIAWWTLGLLVWISLVAGYLWVFISVIFSLKIASSGAVLVCASLIGELAYSRMSWRRLSEQFSGLISVKTDGVFKLGSYRTSQTDADDFNLLLATTPSNARWPAKEDEFFNIAIASHHVNQVLALSIGISAVIGTLIWGYIPVDW